MNPLEQFGNSLGNFRSYHSLSQTRGGKSFLYIFILFLLCYLIGNTYTVMQFDETISNVQSVVLDNVPDFRLSNGEFIFEGPEPFRIGGDINLIVIDTSGKTTLDDLAGISNGLLITKTEMIAINDGQTEITPFSMFEPLEISKDQIVDFLPKIKGIIIAGLAIWFIFAFAGKLFGILILTLVAIIATSIFRQKLTFANQWNVAIYASTLPMLIKLVNTLLGSPLSLFMFIIYWGIAITYVFLGISKMPEANLQEPLPITQTSEIP